MALTPIPTGTDTQVNTYTSSDQIYSSVTALNDGGFVVTWSSDGQDGSGYGIYGQRYAADGTPVGSEFRANTSTSSDQIYSSVTALNDGGFVVTWSSFGQDGSGYGIYGQRYAADGTPVGSEFRANTSTSSDQVYSSVTALNDGGFVVTWSSDGQDGSGWGIYGQRYAADGTPGGERVPRQHVHLQRSDLFLRDGAQRRRLRGDVVVVRPGRQRLWHLRPALCGGRHARWGASSAPTRTPPTTRSIPP